MSTLSVFGWRLPDNPYPEFELTPAQEREAVVRSLTGPYPGPVLLAIAEVLADRLIEIRNKHPGGEPMTEIRDIAAEAICNTTSSGVLFPWETLNEQDRERWAVMADGAIAALQLAGYAVVKLADEDSVADYGLYPVRTHNFGMPVAEQHDAGTRFRSIGETRSYAAALLAVASAAEALQ